MRHSKVNRWTFAEVITTTQIFLKERWLWTSLVLILPIGLGLYHVITGAPLGAKGGTAYTYSSASPLWGGLAMIAFGLILIAVSWTLTHLSRFLDTEDPESKSTRD